MVEKTSASMWFPNNRLLTTPSLQPSATKVENLEETVVENS